MAAPQSITKEQIVSQLRNEGVNDLESLADFIVRRAKGGDPNGPVTNEVIIFTHGLIISPDPGTATEEP